MDSDKFEIVRRIENTLCAKPLYERIIFNRVAQTVEGFTFEEQSSVKYTERYIYKKTSEATHYDMFLYKNPGLKGLLRFKVHNWGVQTMEQVIRKEIEIKARINEST